MKTAFVEKDCVFELQGKSFESGGAVVTDRYLLAYPYEDGVLKTWHGQPIGRWTIKSSRPAVFFGHRSSIGSRYYYMTATLDDGRKYAIRGFGVGMIAKGKRIKSN